MNTNQDPAFAFLASSWRFVESVSISLAPCWRLLINPPTPKSEHTQNQPPMNCQPNDYVSPGMPKLTARDDGQEQGW